MDPDGRFFARKFGSRVNNSDQKIFGPKNYYGLLGTNCKMAKKIGSKNQPANPSPDPAPKRWPREGGRGRGGEGGSEPPVFPQGKLRSYSKEIRAQRLPK